MFSDIVKEEYRKIFLHGDMALSRLMLYAQSIEESKHWRRSRDAKRRRTEEQIQPSFRRGLQFKMVLMILRLTMREVVVPKWSSLLVLLVERIIWGSF